MRWIYRTKLKALLWTVAATLGVIGAVALAGLPWLPAVGMAVAAVAVSVNKVASRLSKPTCLGCGHDLSAYPRGVHGVVCPHCGAISHPGPFSIARGDEDDDGDAAA